MAIIANTFTSHSAVGIREDLANVIYDVSPEETPFMSNIGESSVTNTLFEWQQDSLAAPDGANSQIDGDDVTAYTAVTPTQKIHNRTNISRKVFIIADNLEFVDEAGRASEIAYQTVN